MITTRAEAAALAGRLKYRTYPVTGIDCETEGIDPRKQPAAGHHGRIVCWSIAWYEGTELVSACVWDNAHTRAVLSPLLPTLPVVGHNVYGFDTHLFRKNGIRLENVVADTLRLSKLLNPDDDADHGLKALMQWQLGWEPIGNFQELFTRRAFLDVEFLEEKRTKRKVGEYAKIPTLLGGSCSRLGSGTQTIPLSEIPEHYPYLMPVLAEYAALDARATLALWVKWQPLLNKPHSFPICTHSGTTPARLFRGWKQPVATSTSSSAKPHTTEQQPTSSP